MALIICPECGKEISDRVKDCPHCGYPFETEGAVSTAQKVEITSINIKPKNPHALRNILIGVFSLVIIGAIAATSVFYVTKQKERQAYNAYVESYNRYIDKLDTAMVLMLDAGADAEQLCNLTGQVWANAIYEEFDPETDPYTRKPEGGFYSDFNLALGSLYKASRTQKTIERLESAKTLVEMNMKDFQNPPEGLETAYETVTELYTIYSGLTDLAVNPSGSLKTYGETKNSKIQQFMALYDKLQTQIPEKLALQ